jgi:hypothetical protein
MNSDYLDDRAPFCYFVLVISIGFLNTLPAISARVKRSMLIEHDIIPRYLIVVKAIPLSSGYQDIINRS